MTYCTSVLFDFYVLMGQYWLGVEVNEILQLAFIYVNIAFSFNYILPKQHDIYIVPHAVTCKSDVVDHRIT